MIQKVERLPCPHSHGALAQILQSSWKSTDPLIKSCFSWLLLVTSRGSQEVRQKAISTPHKALVSASVSPSPLRDALPTSSALCVSSLNHCIEPCRLEGRVSPCSKSCLCSGTALSETHEQRPHSHLQLGHSL